MIVKSKIWMIYPLATSKIVALFSREDAKEIPPFVLKLLNLFRVK